MGSFRSKVSSNFKLAEGEQIYLQELFNKLKPQFGIIQASLLKEQYKQIYDANLLTQLIGNKNYLTFDQFSQYIIHLKRKNHDFELTTQGIINKIQSSNTHPQRQQSWGRLISLNSVTSEDYEMIEDEITIGKGFMNSLWIKEKSLSLTHCKLVYNRASQTAIVADLSVNGTFLGNHRIGKGNEMVIKNGDKLFLQQKTQNKQQPQTTIIGFIVILHQIEQKERRDIISNQFSELLNCYICNQIVYKSITLLPCQDIFCCTCLCEFNMQLLLFIKCPKCKIYIESFFLNKKIDLISEFYLDRNQEMRRPKEHYLEMDKKNKDVKLKFEGVPKKKDSLDVQIDLNRCSNLKQRQKCRNE